jgi:hypothetical protein
MAGEYATSLRKTPVVATPAKAPVKTAPKQAAPVVEKPKTVTPPKVTAPAPAPVAAPQAAPVAPPAAVRAQAAEAKVEQRAPIASTQAPPPASPSILGRVGNFLADYGKAAMSPLTEMAVIPMAQGTTQAYANQKVAATGVDVSKTPQVTMSAEAKNKLNPFVDPVTGKVDRTSQALTGASIVGGAAAGAAVGKYVLPAAGRAISNRVSRMADIPDGITKFQGPMGGVKLSDDEMLANAARAAATEGPQLKPVPYVKPTTSTSTKVKATISAGLAANPATANAGARAVIQDVSVVPRTVVGRMTKEFADNPNAVGQFAGQGAKLRANAATAAAARRTAAARATRADIRDSASRLTGSAAGASIAGYASSSIPDSSISIINNNAAANAIRKASQPSTADRIAQTRAEDIAPVINNVKNPFNNSVTGSTSTSNVSNPNPPEGPPTKYTPPIAGDFKGGVGQQDVMLKKVF